MAEITFASDSDPKMQAAKARARETFRFFWRELAWEKRRIVPALDLAAIKVAFRDPPAKAKRPEPEEMWVGDVDFDGKTLSGTLLNAPSWLRTIAEGDPVEVPLEGISDWMYVLEGRAYGGHTVNVIRASMSRGERKEHDQAWGFDFGDPAKVEVLPKKYADPSVEHPMALNMGPSLEKHLKDNPRAAKAADERGLTILHELALAGTKTGVRIALAHGADRSARTAAGLTALDLAKALGWSDVIALLG